MQLSGSASNENSATQQRPEQAGDGRSSRPPQAELQQARLGLNQPNMGSNNLLNLANIDNAFFNQQQQERAEMQHQLHLAAPAAAGSSSSNTSTECLTSERASTSTSSSSSTPYAARAGQPNGGQQSQPAGSQQAQHQPQLVGHHQPADQNAYQELQMSQSDTTDDIQSLTSQFNLYMGNTNPPTPAQQQQQYQSQASQWDSQQQQHPTTELAKQTPQAAPFIQGHGHYFTKKTFHKPTYCHHCADMLWGLIGQGYFCEVCNFVVHERCMKTVVSCCSTVASSAIKNPMPHCWIEAHAKRKFCNVCRKRIEDNASAIRCSVCEYCVHLECQEFSISDCRECATYVPDQNLKEVVQQHHWREGNLPQNSAKCYWCKKSCFSAECLTGMRCEWCQITVHASCLKHAPRDCSLGCLQSIMLLPYSVSIPRTDVPMETIIGVQSRFNLSGYQLQSLSGSNLSGSSSIVMGSSSTGGPTSGIGSQVGVSSMSGLGSKRDNMSPRSTSEDFCQSSLYYQQQQQQLQEDLIPRDKDEEMLRVYDGNSSMRKRSFRLITVHRLATRDTLIAACLRAFYIHDCVSHYALFDITDGERELDQSCGQPVMCIISRKEAKPSLRTPAILLRYRPPDSFKGTIRVYPGRLNVTDLTYCQVQVTSDTSVDEVMRETLDKFKLRSNDLNRYRLVEVSLDKGSSVHERTMDNQECPWEIIKNVARESVRQKENTRFYLQQQDEVYCSSVAIFVGNLPTNLSQKQYESMLMEHLGKPYRFKQINPIYYEYGSCIITYDNADIAVKAFYMLRESTIKCGDESKALLVLLLPNIVPEMIPEGIRVSRSSHQFHL